MFLLFPCFGYGAIYKLDNNTNLNIGTSWLGGVVPGPADTAYWTNNITTARTNALGVSAAWYGIVVNNATGSCVIAATSGQTLTIGPAGIDMSGSKLAQDFTIACLLAPNGNENWNVKSGRTLTLSGNVTNSSTPFTVTLNGVGTVAISSAITYSNLFNISSGSLTFAGTIMSGNYNQAIVNNGLLKYNGASAQTFSGAMSGTGQLQVANSGALTLSAVNSMNGPINISNGGLYLTNPAVLYTSAFSADIVNNYTFGYYSKASQTISGTMSGTGELTVANSGTLTLTGTNSVSGPVKINNATLVLSGTGTLQSVTSIIVTNGGSLKIYSTASTPLSKSCSIYLYPNSTMTISTNISLTVNKVYINGVALGTASYGGEWSDADFTGYNKWFKNMGMVSITNGPYKARLLQRENKIFEQNYLQEQLDNYRQ